MYYLNNLLTDSSNKLKTAGIVMGSVCVGIIGIVSAAFISYGIIQATISTTSTIDNISQQLIITSTRATNIVSSLRSSISQDVFDNLNTGTGISYSSDISYNVINFSADVTDDTIAQFDVDLSIKRCTGLKIYKSYNKTGIYAEYLKEYINGTSGPFTGADINSEKCSFSLFIKDNGRGDEDNINGKITDQMIVSYNKSTTTTTTPPALKEFKRDPSIDLTNTMDFTIVHYLGKTAPSGWQLCDGKPLLDVKGFVVVNSDSDVVYVPDLRGRMVLGVNAANSLTKTKIGQSGGEERHLLNINEMPSHTHDLSQNAVSYGWGGAGYTGGKFGFTGKVTIGYTGGSQSHNNMPPIFALNYIIKQPQNGGTSYKIYYPGQTPNTLFKT